MTTRRADAGTFTGRHMLIVMISFFTVVISVNVLMATLANTTWSGLVVENSYVASQQFNQKAAEGRAQAALGWTGSLTVGNGEVGYGLTDRNGVTIRLDAVTVTFRHPAYDTRDATMALARTATGRFSVARVPADGVWIVDVEASAGRDKPYRDIRRIKIVGGALQ